MKISKRVYAGLSCVCVWDNKAKFFLFADIDSKDPEHLRLIVQEFARNGLDFFVTSTRKGFHVVSPNMLDIDIWNTLKNKVKSLLPNYYKFLVIRIDKQRDDKILTTYLQSVPTYPISSEMVLLFENRFELNKRPDIVPIPMEHKGSILQYATYEHHEIDD